MNKKIIIGVIVGVLIVAGGVSAFIYKDKIIPSSSNQTVKNVEDAKSLKELLAVKDAQQCTFDYQGENAKSSGKIYLANGQMKGEFKTQYNNQETVSYMVIKDDTLYAWENESEVGISLPLKEYWDAQANQEANVNTPIKSDEKIDYKCSDWSDNDEAFEVPSDIEFTSMQEMMGQMMELQNQGMEESGIDCSVCDQVPAGSGQEQCKAALGC